MTDLVLATRNRNKVREFSQMLHANRLDLNILSIDDFPGVPVISEDAQSFRENAIKKALMAAKSTGKLALADDSGLEVDALAGKPGVLSSRFAGRDASDKENNEKLVALLRDVSEKRRQAEFVCFVALANPERLIDVVAGRCKGVIVSSEKGSGGFGYDPLFQPVGYGKTFAELPLEVKNRISHRARAMEKAQLVLEKYLYRTQLENPKSHLARGQTGIPNPK